MEDFPARWQCGDWSAFHGWVHIVADVVTWASYMAIPVALAYFAKKRPDLPYRWVLYLFVAFIMFCGVTHLMEAIIFWWPAYRLLGVMKAGTALVSLTAAVTVFFMLPKLLRIPVAGELEKEIERRKDIERKLSESEAVLNSAIKHAPIGMALVSTTGEWIRVNEKLCEILGYSDEELHEMTFQQITFPDDLNKDLEQLQQTLRGEIDEYMMEKRYVRKGGEVIWANLSVALIRDDAGDPMFFVSQIRDIHMRKMLQQKQKMLISVLEQKNKDLQQIVYVASHDLRSPLLNIIGFSAELENGAKRLREVADSEQESDRREFEYILDKDIPEMVSFITISGRRMDMLLKGLLQYSRLGRYPVCPEKINMDELFAELADSIAFQLKEVDGSLKITELPDCYGDRSLMSQLFSNLLDNAIKYRSPERPLQVSVYAESHQSTIRYTVEDNGQGVSPQHQDRIFEIFHRLNPDRQQGEGLGLSICALIANRFGGRIFVNSAVGEGSRFHVELPADGDVLIKREAALQEARDVPHFLE
ncbi:MAG: sensor histidine kinase [Puniceicoccales bacterium]